MKKILSTHDIAHELSSNLSNGFTYNGAYALAEWLEQYEEETGEEIELDTVAIRCEWDEYESAWEAAAQYATPEELEPETDDEEEKEKAALAYLEERTTVIPFNGGVIIQAF